MAQLHKDVSYTFPPFSSSSFATPAVLLLFPIGLLLTKTVSLCGESFKNQEIGQPLTPFLAPTWRNISFMARLLDLPDELIVHIIDCLPVSAHFEFAMSCKRCFACSQDILRLHRGCALAYGTVLSPSQEIPSLLQTASTDEVAAWNVRSLDVLLDWLLAPPKSSSIDENEQNRVNALMVSHLHLCEDWHTNFGHNWIFTPGEFHDDVCTTLLFAFCPRLQSLELRKAGAEEIQGEADGSCVPSILEAVICCISVMPHRPWPVGLQALRKVELNKEPRSGAASTPGPIYPPLVSCLLLLPSLEWLYVDGLHGPECSSKIWTISATPSNLQHLTLSRPSWEAKHTRRILDRIKALKSLVLLDWDWDRSAPEDVVGHLCDTQSHSLEVLSFSRRMNIKLPGNWPEFRPCPIGTPSDQVRYPYHLQPLNKPRLVTVNMANLATAVCNKLGLDSHAYDRVAECARALINNLPLTIEILKLIDEPDPAASLNISDLDAVLCELPQSNLYLDLKVLDLTSLCTSLRWTNMVVTPTVAAARGIKVYMPGQALPAEYVISWID